jgi:hypothetical protein
VRQLGVTKRPANERDRASIALGKSVRPCTPSSRRAAPAEDRGVDPADAPSWPPLRDIVGLQPCLGERAAQAGFVLALGPTLERLREHANRFGVLAALQRSPGASQRRLKGDRDHRREYTTVR